MSGENFGCVAVSIIVLRSACLTVGALQVWQCWQPIQLATVVHTDRGATSDLFWLASGASAQYNPSMHAWVEVVYPAWHWTATPLRTADMLFSEVNCCALADGTYIRGLITTARQCTVCDQTSHRCVTTTLNRTPGTRKALLEPGSQRGHQPPADRWMLKTFAKLDVQQVSGYLLL